MLAPILAARNHRVNRVTCVSGWPSVFVRTDLTLFFYFFHFCLSFYLSLSLFRILFRIRFVSFRLEIGDLLPANLAGVVKWGGHG